MVGERIVGRTDLVRHLSVGLENPSGIGVSVAVIDADPVEGNAVDRAEAAEAIRRHVREAKRLLESGGRIRMWDPLFRELLDQQEERDRALAARVGPPGAPVVLDARLRRVKIHEQAAIRSRLLTADGDNVVEHSVAVVNVSAACKRGRDFLGPIRIHHLLRTHNERDVDHGLGKIRATVSLAHATLGAGEASGHC